MVLAHAWYLSTSVPGTQAEWSLRLTDQSASSNWWVPDPVRDCYKQMKVEGFWGITPWLILSFHMHMHQHDTHALDMQTHALAWYTCTWHADTYTYTCTQFCELWLKVTTFAMLVASNSQNAVKLNYLGRGHRDAVCYCWTKYSFVKEMISEYFKQYYVKYR